jgi:hypothetical protein
MRTTTSAPAVTRYIGNCQICEGDQKLHKATGFATGFTCLMADVLNNYESAKAKLDEAKAQLDKLTDKDFSADKYDWERLCRVREDKS